VSEDEESKCRQSVRMPEDERRKYGQGGDGHDQVDEAVSYECGRPEGDLAPHHATGLQGKISQHVGEQQSEKCLVERLHCQVQLAVIAHGCASGFAESNADTAAAVSRICQ